MHEDEAMKMNISCYKDGYILSSAIHYNYPVLNAIQSNSRYTPWQTCSTKHYLDVW